jgi:Streptomycin adenylyltransferase
MSETSVRREMVQRIADIGQHDHRIVGLVDYGSAGGHEVDSWSDIDVAVFLYDAQFETFTSALPEWLDQLGVLLLLIKNETTGHPLTRAVYDVEPLPLRVDMVYYRLGEMRNALRWPQIPTADTASVWYDATDGQLTFYMQQLADQNLRPSDLREAFEQTAQSFWYYLLDSVCKLQRGDQWGTRQLFHVTVVPPLIRLLRLEGDAISRWYGYPTTQGIERALSPERLVRLNACLADAASLKGMADALKNTAQLASEVCSNVATQHDYAWPQILAKRVEMVLAQC